MNNQKPDWLRVKAPQNERIGYVSDLLSDLNLNTVCQEASCPNIGECFAGGTATFLIMGPGCTRACPYCDIAFDKSERPLDKTEPKRLGEAVSRLGLSHVVITSVNRDDLSDGGANQFVACIKEVRDKSPSTTVEVLIPDSNAICPASCIIGPSPNGSLKGIPISIISTPDLIATSTIFSVLFFSGKPAVIYIIFVILFLFILLSKVVLILLFFFIL